MIKIITSPHTSFAAKILAGVLNNLGYSVGIVNEVNDNDNSTYIIYNAFRHKKLPKNYIICQTEISQSHWFNKHYLNAIKNAKAVWEYSSENIEAYYSQNQRVAIVTPGAHKQRLSHKNIDYLFYGWIEGSEHRNKVISHLSNNIPLTIVTNKLERAIWGMLNRAKVVINIHYYDHSPLEIFRINEALSHNCMVVSECPSNDRYENLVSFADNTDELIKKAILAHETYIDYDLSQLNNRLEVERAISKFGI